MTNIDIGNLTPEERDTLLAKFISEQSHQSKQGKAQSYSDAELPEVWKARLDEVMEENCPEHGLEDVLAEVEAGLRDDLQQACCDALNEATSTLLDEINGRVEYMAAELGWALAEKGVSSVAAVHEKGLPFFSANEIEAVVQPDFHEDWIESIALSESASKIHLMVAESMNDLFESMLSNAGILCQPAETNSV